MVIVLSLTDPARPGADNEDAVFVGAGVGVVVDGAGLPQELRRGCSHPVSWFAQQLAHRFGTALEDGEGMRPALAAAIVGVRDAHSGTCDLAAGSPSATVAAWRRHTDTVELLSLCDAAALVIDRGEVELLADLRIDEVVPRRARQLRGLTEARGTHGGSERRPVGEPSGRAAGGPATREDLLRRRALTLRALEETRNTEDGFWCAHTDPAAAQEARVRTLDRRDGMTLVAASDGATRAFLRLGTHTLRSFGQACADGPLEAIRDEVRAAEQEQAEHLRRRGSKVHDDLTLVVARG